MHVVRELVEVGGLMSYGPNFADLFRRAAGHVDKILRGTKPGDIPVEQPTKFDLAINLTTAKALGLTIPESFLLRADELIGCVANGRCPRTTPLHLLIGAPESFGHIATALKSRVDSFDPEPCCCHA
jgi:hypothetical protein